VLFSANGLQFDFSALRAADIAADLRLRDFTLNAIALSLNRPAVLIDPLGGRNDLQAGVLRSCGPTVLGADPLRILKGIRHFAEHGWQIEAQTAAQMKQAAPLLSKVAGERIKTEFGRILMSERVGPALDLLNNYGVLEQLFGISPRGELAALFEPIVNRIEKLEGYPQLSALLTFSLEDGLTRRALLLLAKLLTLVPDQATVSRIILRFRFSRSCSALLSRLSKSDSFSLDQLGSTATSRIAALKVEALGRNGLDAILAGLISRQEETFDKEAARWISSFLEFERKGKIDNLLDGKTLMRLTGLRAGSEVGLLQERIKAAEIAGEISDKTSAVHWLKARFSD
jgi:tRNA nucleotidyltransferase/poly(A) polymerase